ncbi:MAG TPA: YMGG-like glycine zipper-containing protein [Pyrinomonadaceae bacterium]
MRTLTKTICLVVLGIVVAAGAPNSAVAQYTTSDSSVRDLINTIQSRTDTFRRRIQNSSDRGNLNSSQVNELNRLINDFAFATDQLERRLGTRRTSTSTNDVRLVLDRATLIDNYAFNYRLGGGSEREWQTIRADLDQLANAYNINWQWSSGGSTGGSIGIPNDQQLRLLLQRVDSRTSNFSRNLRQDLNRRDLNDRNRASRQLSQYETAVVNLRNRINSRQVTSQDVQNVLEEASFLNSYVGNEQLSYQTENSWLALRSDLEQLASLYNIAWNWSSSFPDAGTGTFGQLTGTYRIITSRGDDPRRAAELATRNLPENERQRVFDMLIRRLDPPNMLAIDQRGNAVSIGSTRAPQISFVADGREQVETNARGRTVRVRASLTGDRLSINRSGDRADDFVVTFETLENGRQLLVTRQLFSDRFSQPVSVRSYYERTADVAQLNLYETNPEGGAATTGTVSGNFIVPNGTLLTAVLNNNLSTREIRENERFTMTVRSPGQFEGATIEGYVMNVNRAGRVTGRSELTLNFDNIRLRDGRTYSFAGIMENVRTPNGDVVRVDNEGAVRDDDSQTNRTVTRTAIGTAVGAIIGAIAGGGKGAAIGAVIGAGAGAGSVYIQGRNELELPTGTEISVRATGPRG